MAIIGSVKVWRNTLRGHVLIDHLTSSDGPWTFKNNVIINTEGAQTPWAYLYDDANVTDSSRLTSATASAPTGTEILVASRPTASWTATAGSPGRIEAAIWGSSATRSAEL